MLKIIKAVMYCHSKGVIHKDLKLKNIMIDKLNKVRIIDFGCSEILPRKYYELIHFCGTPYYMAPEMIKKTKFSGKK